MKKLITGNREGFQERCFLCGFGILTFMKAVGMQDGDLDYKIFLVIGMLFFAVKIVVSDNSLKEWGIILLFTLLGGVSYVKSGDKGLLIYIVLMLGMKKVKLERAMLVGATLWCGGIAMMTALSMLGIVADTVIPNNRPIIGMVGRHDLGYSHPNTLGLAVVTAIMYAAYCIFLKMPKKKAAIGITLLSIIGGLYFFFSYSFTSMSSIVLFWGLSLYGIYHDQLPRAARIVGYLSLPFCVVISYIVPFAIYGTDKFDLTKSILRYFLSFGGRFRNSLNAMMQWPPLPFGRRIDFVTDSVGWSVVDNSYVWLLIQAGWVPTIILLMLYAIVIKEYIQCNRKIELAIIITLLLAGISEPLLFNTSCKNIIFLFAGEVLYQKMNTSDLCGTVCNR